MQEASSGTEETRDGWGVNERGYIQGGFDTPIFLQAKQRFNRLRTDKKNPYRKLLVKEVNTDPSFMPRYTPDNEFVIMTGPEPTIKENNA